MQGAFAFEWRISLQSYECTTKDKLKAAYGNLQAIAVKLLSSLLSVMCGNAPVAAVLSLCAQRLYKRWLQKLPEATFELVVGQMLCVWPTICIFVQDHLRCKSMVASQPIQPRAQPCCSHLQLELSATPTLGTKQSCMLRLLPPSLTAHPLVKHAWITATLLHIR